MTKLLKKAEKIAYKNLVIITTPFSGPFQIFLSQLQIVQIYFRSLQVNFRLSK